jgi:AmmeMemoRadiSam system protein A
MYPLVFLAKQTVETYIKEGKIISPPNDLPKEFLERKAGTFVTIEKNGNLRGCIGTYLPTRINIAEEIIRNAIAAATEDYRFGPVEKEELPYLSYTVYILNEPELVTELDPVKWASPKIRRILFDRVNPKKYGIIIKTVPISPSGDVVFNGHFVAKTGLLLPDLEGVDSVEKQISIACQKAGIDPLSEKFLIYKFTVEKYQ